jgi:hypothetical protein
MAVNNQLGKIWKEVVMAYFKVLPHHLPGVTEENNINSESEYLTSRP